MSRLERDSAGSMEYVPARGLAVTTTPGALVQGGGPSRVRNASGVIRRVCLGRAAVSTVSSPGSMDSVRSGLLTTIPLDVAVGVCLFVVVFFGFFVVVF